jgi:hypothetical protein
MFRSWTIVLLLAGALAAAAQPRQKHRDYVPDEKTAKRIAEAVLVAQYGEERVKAQLPLLASAAYKDYWIVQGQENGSATSSRGGGGLAVFINKHSGCIGNVIEHMK